MEVMHPRLDEDELETITPADWVPGPPQGEWTYEAYAMLADDGKCYEIVQGVLVMSPAPQFIHQRFIVRLTAYLCGKIIERRLGEVITGPFDVVLSPKGVYQPDVLVLLNAHLNRLQEKYVLGAPDLVVEVISPGSKLYDRVNKHMAYEQAGVPEYWLVDPRKQSIELFILEDAKYRSQGIFTGEQIPPSRIVPQMDAPVVRFFA